MRELIEIVNEFKTVYHQRDFICTTSYMPINLFIIHFDLKQLPHLLGLHKIYNSNPIQILANITKGTITKEKLKRNKNYGDIKDRLVCCDFLNKIFAADEKIIVYIAEVDRRNTMRLDIAFYESLSNKKYVLGLRRTSDKTYVPVTFYAVKSTKKEFIKSKRVKINQIEIL